MVLVNSSALLMRLHTAPHLFLLVKEKNYANWNSWADVAQAKGMCIVWLIHINLEMLKTLVP